LTQKLRDRKHDSLDAKKTFFFGLLRKWHPDKYEGKKDIADEVTKFLTTEKDAFLK